MSESKRRDESTGTTPARHTVRLPGFVTEETIGLGDLVKRATYLIGVKPCAGCEQRATALDRWLTFGPKK